MSRGEPSLLELRVAVVVSRLGTISAAADHLGLSQPTASKRLAAFERRVGMTVLRRSRGGAEPTEAGRGVLELAAAVVDAADRLQLAINGQPVEEILIAASYGFADDVLAPLLEQFWAGRGPKDVTLRVLVGNSEDVRRHVREHRADLGLFEGEARVGGTLEEHAGPRFPLFLAVPPRHPWAAMEAVPAPAVAAERMILREPGGNARTVLEQALRRLGYMLPPPVMEYAGSGDSLRRVLREQRLPTIGAGWSFRREIAAGQLVLRPLAEADLTARLVAAHRRGHPTRAAADLLQVFLERTPGIVASLHGPHAK